MRYDPDHESPDVVDRRGEGSGKGIPLGGILSLLPFLLRSKWGWLLLACLAAYAVFRGGFGGSAAPGGPTPTHGVASGTARGEDDTVHFVSFVLDDTQATWTRKLASTSTPYRHAKLVLFTDATQTGCGYGKTASGPFYCPTDERVYIDLAFFRELERRFGAPGRFAQAYVIAHEIGHHVQKVLGTNDKVNRLHGPTQGAEGASVRLELQADCYAGIWANTTGQRNLLEKGDVEGALRAAAAIGDDRLQKSATGTVRPESWTHGASEERTRWFRHGYEGGKLEACDTFGARQL